MAARRIGLVALTVISLSAASCADSPDAAPAPQESSTTTSAPSTSTTTSTTTSAAPSTTQAAPTTTTDAADEPGFDIPQPPPDLRACSPTSDLFTAARYVDGSPDLDIDALFVINISATPCGLRDPGFLVRGEPVPVGDPLAYAPGSAVLDRGGTAVFLVTSPRPEGSTFDLDAIDAVHFGLDGEYSASSNFSKSVEGMEFIGPVDWAGPPDRPIVFVPADPDEGTPIGEDDLVTTAGLGAFRAGMSPPALADATGQTFVVHEWGVASEGCGYGWLAPDLEFTISSPTTSLDDATVGAVSRPGDRRTPSGLGVGTTVDELRAALGDDRLSTRLNEYSGIEDYLFTPRDPDEQHLGMFFRIDPETLTVSSYEAGLMTQIGRGEGCA